MKDKEEQRCRLFEIEQYICEIEDKENARVRCYPLPRIFRLYVNSQMTPCSILKITLRCQGRPAVEVTALVDVNPKTGEITIPENMRLACFLQILAPLDATCRLVKFCLEASLGVIAHLPPNIPTRKTCRKSH